MSEQENLRDKIAKEFDQASWYGRPPIDYFNAGWDERDKLKKSSVPLEVVESLVEALKDQPRWFENEHNELEERRTFIIAREALLKFEEWQRRQ